MDLRLMARVLGRFKVLVLVGFALAASLAFLAYAAPSFGGGFKLKYRSTESWSSYMQLLVTQRGFTWGSTLAHSNENSDVEAERTAEGRLVTLATIYSKLAVADEVKAIVKSRTPIRGLWDASPVQAARDSDEYLPIITISAYAPTAQKSRDLANIVGSSLKDYIERQQAAAQPPIQAHDRVQLHVLARGGHTVLASPRSKTLPVVIFVTLMGAVIFLAFVLENIRPRRVDRSTTSSPSDVPREAAPVLLPDVHGRSASR
jgi:capsular polysaccharide biosynthesis protein